MVSHAIQGGLTPHHSGSDAGRMMQSEFRIGQMGRWLADNKKISHKEDGTFALRCIGPLLFFACFRFGSLFDFHPKLTFSCLDIKSLGRNGIEIFLISMPSVWVLKSKPAWFVLIRIFLIVLHIYIFF